MSARSHRRKMFASTLFIFLVLFLGISVDASAAWKKNSNGTYSYYQNGKLQKNKWIEQDYYVDSKGVRKTGWAYLNKKWYFFSKNGRVIRSRWIKSQGKMYYAGESGAVYTNGRRKVGEYYYAFDKRGARLTGKRVYSKKTYFFGTKTGRMLTSSWVKEKKKYYYYGEDGVLAKNQWVGRYYVGATGARVAGTWKGKRYLGKDGKALSGLHQLGDYTYYFDKKTYEKVTNTTLTVDGVTYQFDSKGRSKIEANGKAPKTSVNVEKTYYSDKYVEDETLLAALIYCEAGNQSYTGQVGVGLVIMNRMNSSKFPSKLREIVYQKQQFAPARDGSLTKTLKDQSRITESCKKAAAEVMNRIKTYKKGSSVKLKIGEKNENFNYLFFMTPAAYQGLGLSAKYKKLGGHVFFSKWG